MLKITYQFSDFLSKHRKSRQIDPLPYILNRYSTVWLDDDPQAYTTMYAATILLSMLFYTSVMDNTPKDNLSNLR